MSHDVPLDWNDPFGNDPFGFGNPMILRSICQPLANTLASGLGGSGRAYGICAAKCSQCLSSEGGR